MFQQSSARKIEVSSGNLYSWEYPTKFQKITCVHNDAHVIKDWSLSLDVFFNEIFLIWNL